MSISKSYAVPGLPIPSEARALSAVASSYQVARHLAVNVGRLALNRRRRTPALVSREYDSGVWKRMSEDPSWRHVESLEAFVCERTPGAERELVALVEGLVCRVPNWVYYQYRAGKLQQILECLADDEELIELGCGYGRNLLGLRMTGDWSRLSGYDISETAILTAREIAGALGQADIRFDHLDLRDRTHPNFADIAKKTVFTYYCLEQLPYDTRSVLENMLDARPKRVIHVEPTGELLKWWRPIELVSLLYIRSRDYQRSLVKTLRELEAERRIRLLALQREWFAPTIQHSPVIAAWEPR